MQLLEVSDAVRQRVKMECISDKTCVENQNIHFVFDLFFPKIVPFVRCFGKK